MTRRWWAAVWRSPHSHHYLNVDVLGLIALAELMELYWDKPTTALAAGILRVQEDFGLTPRSRRRLGWETADQASFDQRADRKPTPVVTDADPRHVLELVD